MLFGGRILVVLLPVPGILPIFGTWKYDEALGIGAILLTSGTIQGILS
jgi:hypothetical protein